MDVFGQIQEVLQGHYRHAVHITHVPSGEKVKNPRYGQGGFKRYFTHLSEISNQDFTTWFKEEARKMGSGHYLFTVRKRNGSTYMALQPQEFKCTVPVQIQSGTPGPGANPSGMAPLTGDPQPHTPMYNHTPPASTFGLSQPQIMEMYADNRDYKRLLEERTEHRERIAKLERELEAAIRKADHLQLASETKEARNEITIERLKAQLENEKATYKRELEAEKETFIKNHKSFLDQVDLNKLAENPAVMNFLGQLMARKETTGIVPGLTGPEENLSQIQRMFITVARQMPDVEIEKLYTVKHLLSDVNFHRELNALIKKYGPKHKENEEAA